MNIFPHKTIFAANLQQNFEMCKLFPFFVYFCLLGDHFEPKTFYNNLLQKPYGIVTEFLRGEAN